MTAANPRVATTDVLGEPYTVETIELPADAEGEVVATLVRRPVAEATGRAVLHVHGFSDYFFQTEYAEWWNARGYDFYALDLRKAGRSLRPGQTPHYVGDLREYAAELDAAWALITDRDDHGEVVVSAHSTGGLTVSLWLDERRPPGLVGVVLNSPWLDMQGSTAMRVVGTPVIKAVGARQPMRVISRAVSGLYTTSLHRDTGGEFDFDLAWKPAESFPVTVGWLRAIRVGHARLQAGLDVPAPVLVLSSGASSLPTEMGEDVHSTDIVLEVPQIRRWATAIGTRVTYAAITGARHDVTLSRAEPRAAAYDQIDRWLDAYLE